jgi:Ala-tRNA(Pro) deacylase
MNGQNELYELLSKLNIPFDYYEHPAAPTIEIAKKYWADIEAIHCKNIFLRNHKGDKHFLAILNHKYNLDIHLLEKYLKQGKLSFASDVRLKKYLNIEPGSVSPLSLINDPENHVHLFIDDELQNASKISFHPNINTASLVLKYTDFIKFLHTLNRSFEYIKMHD